MGMPFPNVFPKKFADAEEEIANKFAKAKKMLAIYITIHIIVILVLTLCFSINTKRQVDRLYQYFDTFSAEYQSLGNVNPEPAVPVVEAPAEAGNYLNSYTQ